METREEGTGKQQKRNATHSRYAGKFEASVKAALLHSLKGKRVFFFVGTEERKREAIEIVEKECNGAWPIGLRIFSNEEGVTWKD